MSAPIPDRENAKERKRERAIDRGIRPRSRVRGKSIPALVRAGTDFRQTRVWEPISQTIKEFTAAISRLAPFRKEFRDVTLER